jgi:ketosteroid isomerase-like protein
MDRSEALEAAGLSE